MSEIIYTNVTENRDALDRDQLTGKVFLDRKVTLWQSDRKVSVAHSVMLSGTHRGRSDSRWYRWWTYGAYGFYRTSTGLAQPFSCVRDIAGRQSKWVNKPPTDAIGHLYPQVEVNEFDEIFRKAMWETFRVKDFYDLYPLAERWDIEKYEAMPANIRRAFRNTNLNDFAIEVFGSKRYSSKLVSAVNNTDPYLIAVANDFRGHASDKAILNFMVDNAFDDEMEEGFAPHTPKLRKSILPNLDRQSCNNLLTGGFDLSDSKAIQVMSMLTNRHWNIDRLLANKSVKSFQNLRETIYGRNTP